MSVTILDSVFDSNRMSGGYGQGAGTVYHSDTGIYLAGEDFSSVDSGAYLIQNCTFRSNNALRGSALYLHNLPGFTTIRNCVISDHIWSNSFGRKASPDIRNRDFGISACLT